MKPKLLVVELWGLGDLVIATPFLRAATERCAVTLVAKAYAQDLQARLWENVEVVPFSAPWTAFRHKDKYWLPTWPWLEILRLRKKLAAERFDFGASVRWDPRDHFFLALVRAKRRFGFPRCGSQYCLTDSLARPKTISHQYEYWRLIGRALGFELPPRGLLSIPKLRPHGEVLVHTGAAQPVRVWSLDRYQRLVLRLRQAGYRVQVACDPSQRDWWNGEGETCVATPRTVQELLGLVDRAGVFIGNDSGPGHLAAFLGAPTFTFFGPQLPEWFAPLHPASEWIEGKPCPHKPCSDYCQFPTPHCLANITEEEAWGRVSSFVRSHLKDPRIDLCSSPS